MNYLLRNPHFKMAWVDLAVTIGAIIGMALIVTCIYLAARQRYTYRLLQTIQVKLILLCVWAEPGSTKTALKFKYEI
jgi:hypothetical protein